MMPTIVQRPKLLDISEIQSSILRAIRRLLERVEFKMLYLIPQLYTAMRSGGLLEAGLFDEFLYPIPLASRSAAGWVNGRIIGPGRERGAHWTPCWDLSTL